MLSGLEQGLLKRWKEHSHWFLLYTKPLEIALKKFKNFYNQERNEISPNLVGVAQKIGLPCPFWILDIFRGKSKSIVFRSQFWKPDDSWFFRLILICFIHNYNIKVLFGLGWKNQEHTVIVDSSIFCKPQEQTHKSVFVFIKIHPVLPLVMHCQLHSKVKILLTLDAARLAWP